MEGVYFDKKIVNLSRGYCPCGETNGNKYGFCEIMRGKRNPEKCEKCGYEFSEGDDFE